MNMSKKVIEIIKYPNDEQRQKDRIEIKTVSNVNNKYNKNMKTTGKKRNNKVDNDPFVRRSELQAELKPIRDNMVTHEELQAELKPIRDNMVTHEELQAELKPIRDNMVTHEELQAELKPIRDNMVTHEELQAELKPIRDNMVTHEELQAELKPIRETIAIIMQRLDRIDLILQKILKVLNISID
ncbi:hypothetical protein FACS189459_6510 [Bacilli bacterium]|nr:hypothetical protein FACS189459_6510 [Bacilli bacterium]